MCIHSNFIQILRLCQHSNSLKHSFSCLLSFTDKICVKEWMMEGKRTCVKCTSWRGGAVTSHQQMQTHAMHLLVLPFSQRRKSQHRHALSSTRHTFTTAHLQKQQQIWISLTYSITDNYLLPIFVTIIGNQIDNQVIDIRSCFWKTIVCFIQH